jgi:hypothetical protein
MPTLATYAVADFFVVPIFAMTTLNAFISLLPSYG